MTPDTFVDHLWISHQKCSMKNYLKPAILLKNRLWQRSEFCEISKSTFFIEHLWTTAFVLYGAKRLGIPTATLQKHLLLENRLW